MPTPGRSMRTIGQRTLPEPLGRGGMGRVFLASNLTNEVAAVKIQEELKPVRATALLQTTVVPPPFTISPMVIEPKDLGTVSLPDRPYSVSSSAGPIICPPINSPPADLESLNSNSLSYTSGYTSTTLKTDPESLSTPKPDICIGLAHGWFPTNHQPTLNYLKTDPHASVMGLHFPFLIFKAKGNADLFGAQNQATVGTTSMLRILDLIRCGEDTVVWNRKSDTRAVGSLS
ncbi:hypothetical protein CC80DRAFT_555136 [Byssothecium circinans]|uniref:DUF7924 domain-containing protein n=1 Tax=Byssothecium circinans TaxID=147558 RepID=A0A6A5TFU9_9PLEO|nr:hypothetical protein CC80DRAFT_555136 [Byssothecium circinans]